MTSFQNYYTTKNRREFINPELISRHLKCSICTDVFQDPMRTICGHTFCFICIENWAAVNKKCPLCKKSIFTSRKLERDLIAYNIIDDLNSRCLYPSCYWVGQYAFLKKHQRSCKFRPRKAITTGGGEVVNVVEDCEELGNGIVEVVYVDDFGENVQLL